MSGYKTVTMTKTVPVADRESLAVWLDQKMAEWLKDKRDAGASKKTAGTHALKLIAEAGFTLQSPQIPR